MLDSALDAFHRFINHTPTPGPLPFLYWPPLPLAPLGGFHGLVV